MDQIKISKKVFISGLIMLLLGYVSMTFGTETYGFWKITIAPIIIVSAFVLIGFSVMGKKGNKNV